MISRATSPESVADYFFKKVKSHAGREWLLVMNIMVDFPRTVSLQMLKGREAFLSDNNFDD